MHTPENQKTNGSDKLYLRLISSFLCLLILYNSPVIYKVELISCKEENVLSELGR